MRKTKIWLAIFAILFVGAVVGSALIIKVANNQTFDEFELTAIDGYDASAIEGISFDVEYRLKEEGLHHYWDKGDKCEFKYVNGTIKNLQFTEINESEYPFAVFKSYEFIGENRLVGIREDEGFYGFSIADRDGAGAMVRNISSGAPEELHTDDGQYKHFHEKKFWSVEDKYYFFENGVLFTVDKATLCDERLFAMDEPGWGTVYFPWIYAVPSEVDKIVACEGAEYMYLTGIGNVTEKGYTLFSYIIDVTTGDTIDRQCYEKEISNGVKDVNQLSFDYLLTDEDYYIVTITQPMGEQDMYIISGKDNECNIEYFDMEEMLEDGLYINGLLEAKSNGTDTLYLIYGESCIGKMDYDLKWAKRVIMNLKDKMSVEIPKGYESFRDVGFNGVAFVAIKNGDVVYKGYFSSETSKTLGYIISGCMNGSEYRGVDGHEGVFVENIDINLE